ncbi:TcaA second domain-containing protein [Schleiferilactobacillus perolens]|jgi:uncharacterized membrane protein YvbJ|uniref:TcaA second domain-containing protein n=1 Tax=Schleiferilactobacillus perolens TaxID=100468 RepID=UPI002355B611|nr:hypothetical protein [Schleiferilactobacillus perolens]MCI2170078.1 hypothetical protein [Schleiferilactobacillus perolens]
MASEQEFCPRCGTPVAKTDGVCSNCGYNLAAYRQRVQENQKSDNETAAKPSSTSQSGQAVMSKDVPPRKPLSKKQKVGIAAAIGVVLLLAIGYGVGNQYFSRDNQLNRATAAFVKGDAQTAVKYLTTDDSKLSLSDEAVKPLLKMYSKSPSLVTKMKQTALTQVALNSSESDFTFVQDGHRLLLFPAYRFKFRAVYPRVTTNLDSTKFMISGSSAGNTGGSGKLTNQKVGPLAPGQYTVTTTATTGGKKIKSVSTRNLVYGNEELDLTFKVVTFTAKGYPGAEVLINGEKMGKIDKNGVLAIKNYPVTGKTTKMTQVFSANGKKLTSRSTDISEANGKRVSVVYPGVIGHDDAEDLLSHAFQNVRDMARFETVLPGQQELTNTLFENGNKNKDYKQLYLTMSDYRQSKDIASWECRVRLDHVYPLAKDQASAVFNVSWIFEDTQNTNSTNSNRYHVQTFQYQGQIDRNPDTTDTDNRYVIKSFTETKKLADRYTANGTDY